MLLIYGKRTDRIKAVTDHHERCKNCGAFDISVAVFQDYFHLFYIPVWTVSPKNAKACCHECGSPYVSRVFEKQVEEEVRTPFFFYTIPLLFLQVIAFGVMENISNQREKAEMIRNPHVGDTYLIRKGQKDTAQYYFLQIDKIMGDSITLFQNQFVYLSYTSNMAPGDSFVTSEALKYTRKQVQEMFDAGEIISIPRRSTQDTMRNQ